MTNTQTPKVDSRGTDLFFGTHSSYLTPCTSNAGSWYWLAGSAGSRDADSVHCAPGQRRTPTAARTAVARVAAISPPMTAQAERRGLLAAFSQGQGHGDHAGEHGATGHQNGPQPAGAPRTAASGAVTPDLRVTSAKDVSRMALATATPMAMMAPMND